MQNEIVNTLPTSSILTQSTGSDTSLPTTDSVSLVCRDTALEVITSRATAGTSSLGTGNAYRSITEEPSYGFVFDAHFLVSEHGALVGTDLMTEYDQLYHEIAREVAEQLGSKPIDNGHGNSMILQNDTESQIGMFLTQYAKIQ